MIITESSSRERFVVVTIHFLAMHHVERILYRERERERESWSRQNARAFSGVHVCIRVYANIVMRTIVCVTTSDYIESE